jgi:hypothetical protein
MFYEKLWSKQVGRLGIWELFQLLPGYRTCIALSQRFSFIYSEFERCFDDTVCLYVAYEQSLVPEMFQALHIFLTEGVLFGQ